MLKISVFWDVAPCSFFGVERRFRDAYCRHHQGVELMEAVRTFESRSAPMTLHGATFQKALIFIIAAVKTWNLTDVTCSHPQVIPSSSVLMLSSNLLSASDNSIWYFTPASMKMTAFWDTAPCREVEQNSTRLHGAISQKAVMLIIVIISSNKARQGRDADHSPHLVPRSRVSRSYTYSPFKLLCGV
jgi:hypothetical protein